jgi:hypothetical protein
VVAVVADSMGEVAVAHSMVVEVWPDPAAVGAFAHSMVEGW